MAHRGWGSSESPTGGTTASDAEHWWFANGTIRFYGMVLLVGTKSTDAITTAVGLALVPGIVEMNPLADAVFADAGTVTGLVVLSFATVVGTILTTELLALEARRRFGLVRLSLLAQATIYGVLSVLFGAIALSNLHLIGQQTSRYLDDALAVAVSLPA